MLKMTPFGLRSIGHELAEFAATRFMLSPTTYRPDNGLPNCHRVAIDSLPSRPATGGRPGDPMAPAQIDPNVAFECSSQSPLSGCCDDRLNPPCIARSIIKPSCAAIPRFHNHVCRGCKLARWVTLRYNRPKLDDPAPQSAAERAVRPSLMLYRIRDRLKIVACPDLDCG